MKNRIKKLALAIVSAGMVVGFGSVAFAGGPNGHHAKRHGKAAMFEKLEGMDDQERLEFLEDRLDKRVERMTDRLELTSDQQVKVRQIFADAQTQLLDVWERNEDADDRSAARAEAHTVFKQAKQDVSDILTDEQLEKAKEMRHKRVRKGKRFMLEHLDERLELSDTQQAQVKAIMDDAHQKLKALRDSGEPREEMRPQAKAIFEAAADDVNTILDADQQVEFAEMRTEMKERAKRWRGKRGKHGKRGKRGERGERGAF